MIVYNVGFITESRRYEELLAWLRGHAVPSVWRDVPAAGSVSLVTVVDVPGDPEFTSQARNVALQVEFGSLDEAHAWGESVLPGILNGFATKFGKEGVTFSTILETLATE